MKFKNELIKDDVEKSLLCMRSQHRELLLNHLCKKINELARDEISKLHFKQLSEFKDIEEQKLSLRIGKRRKQMLELYLKEQLCKMYENAYIQFVHEHGNIKGYLHSV